MKKNNLVCAFLGTLIEVYDFTIFPLMIPILSKVYFSSHSEILAINFTVLAYVLSYAVKPFGAIGFGFLIDKYGKKKILLLTTLTMTIATSVIGLFPARLLSMNFGLGLIICRLIQGLSISGEFTSAIIMSVEDGTKAAMSGCMAFIGGSTGLLIANLAIYSLLNFIPNEQLLHYAWRVPFLFGAIGCLYLISLRNNIREALRPAELISSRFSTLIKYNKRELLSTFLVSSLSASAFYVTFIYMPTYLSVSLRIYTHQESIFINSLIIIVYIITLPLGGMLACFIGVFRQIQILSFLYLVCSFMIFDLLPKINNSMCIMLLVIFAVIQALLNSALPVFLVSKFERCNRGKALAISYHISLTLFGGLMPYLLLTSKNPLNPGIPICICATLSLVALHFQKEKNDNLRSESIR